MTLFGFFLINFIVSLLADIALNDLASEKGWNNAIIQSLKPYFKTKFIIESGIYAAITICSALVVSCVTNLYLFGFSYPKTFKQLYPFLAISFIIGYIIHIIIDKLKIFGNTLDLYYEIAGAGFWGAVAFEVSIALSFILQKYLVPLL